MSLDYSTGLWNYLAAVFRGYVTNSAQTLAFFSELKICLGSVFICGNASYDTNSQANLLIHISLLAFSFWFR